MSSSLEKFELVDDITTKPPSPEPTESHSSAAMAENAEETHLTSTTAAQEDNKEHINMEAVAQLTDGLLGMWTPTVDNLAETLKEVVAAQEQLVQRIQAEKIQIADNAALDEIAHVMSQLPAYTAKLVQVRKDMVALCEKSSKLKKRAEKLTLRKSKADMQAAIHAEEERQREERLLARPVEEAAVATITTQTEIKKKKKQRNNSGSSSSSINSAATQGIIVVNPGPNAAKTATTKGPSPSTSK
eukprot:m.16842 g.16842  ORF g.16842 m.16842 type:complete len:244 (+) comp8165_c1_seq1:693-1424(+)